MKRMISLTVLIALLFFVYQFLVNLFRPGYEISYSLTQGEDVYQVTEQLLIDGKSPIYRIRLDDGKDTYLLENKTNYNKQQKIISEILTYEGGGVSCIYPIYQDNLEDVHDISCMQNGVQVSGSYLLSAAPELIRPFQEALIARGIVLPSWKEYTTPKEEGELRYYADHFQEGLYTITWRYHSIDIIAHDHYHTTNLLRQDSYDNLGILAGAYYIIPDFDDTAEFQKIIVANVLNFGSHEITLDTPISDDCYFQGVVDGKAYLFDRTNMRQYEINPESRQVRLIGTVEWNGQFYDGDWHTRNIYDFTDTVLFGKDYRTIPEIAAYNPRQVFESSHSYYLVTQDKRVIELWKSDLSHPIVLLSNANMQEITYTDDMIFYIVGDTLYYYQKEQGILPLVIDYEFQYHTKNMYAIYQES